MKDSVICIENVYMINNPALRVFIKGKRYHLRYNNNATPPYKYIYDDELFHREHKVSDPWLSEHFICPISFKFGR